MLENSATEARKCFQETIDHVHYHRENVMITKHGKPWVVIQPINNGASTKPGRKLLKRSK